MRPVFLAAVAASGAFALATTALAQPDTVTLDNGARVVLIPVPGCGRVGVEAVYERGFFDEPRAMTQSAHLLEHCVCMGGAGGQAAGARWTLLAERGMVNAETLADFTHYDYEAPRDDLELLLTVEAERLGGLDITPELVAQEVPRIYAETTAVESNPAAPLMKHAFMAAHQAWRYGSDEAPVRGGLDSIPIEDLRAFHHAAYTPAAVTLVIAGDFEPGAALASVRRTVGALPARGDRARRPPIAWDTLARVIEVRWDARATSVIVAYPPPADPCDRLALSLYGETLYQRLSADPELRRITRSIFCSNSVWPVGDLPLFLYATLVPGSDAGAAGALLAARAEECARAGLSAQDAAMISSFGASFWPPAPTSESARERGAMFDRSRPGSGAGLVVLNHALHTAMRLRLAGAGPGCVERVASLPPEAFSAITARAFDPARRVVTILRATEESK